jgi:hypothetical protein
MQRTTNNEMEPPTDALYSSCSVGPNARTRLLTPTGPL